MELQGFDSPLAAMAQPYAYRLLRAYANISDPDLRETIVDFVERTANQQFPGGSGSEPPPSGRH